MTLGPSDYHGPRPGLNDPEGAHSGHQTSQFLLCGLLAVRCLSLCVDVHIQTQQMRVFVGALTLGMAGLILSVFGVLIAI